MAVAHDRPRPTDARRAEAGVTLVELILSIAISTVIVAAITSALVVGFRTTDDTTARLASSHDTQLVANYFPADVASTRSADVDTDTTAAGCSGLPAGQNVVLLPFAPRLTADPAPVTVTYRTEMNPPPRPGNPATSSLVRYQCGAIGSPVQDRVVVASNLTTEPDEVPAEVPEPSTAEQHTITLIVTEAPVPPSEVGKKFQVTGHPRTPKEVPFTGTGLPTPTTAVPAPCTAAVAALAAPGTVDLSIADPTELVSDVTITVQVSGSCSAPLTVHLDPGAMEEEIPMAPAPGGSGYTATLGRDAYSWTAGVKDFTVTQGGAEPTVAGPSSGSFEVIAAACTVQTPVTVAPNPVTLAASPAAGTLQAPLTVSFTTVGTCASPLRLRLTPGTDEVTKPLVESGNSYAVTIDADEAGFTWTAGTKTVVIELTDGGTVVDDEFSVTVSPAGSTACVITSPIELSPSPAQLGNGSNSADLEDDVALTLTTAGDCSAGLSIVYRPGPPASEAVTRPLASSNQIDWTGTVLADEATDWVTGDHEISVIGTGLSPAPVVTLRVDP